jgi:hypothetical protein
MPRRNAVANPVYVMTTVDTEEEWDWSGPFPMEGAPVTNVGHLDRFQSLCERHGIAATYFTNHAVMADPAGRAVIQSLAGRPGAEIGLHIHPWNTPPLKPGGAVTTRDTYLHNDAPDTIAAKLDTAYAAFVAAGLRPTSFRGGRYSSGGEIHAFLRRKGFVADCSVVPYTTWPDDGAPDFRDRDLMPVRLPPERAGEQALWEIPLSLGYSRPPFALWASVFQAIERTALRRLRLIGIAERLGLVRRVWLNFEVADRHDWTPFMLLLQRLGVPCITLTVHSSSLVAGPGPYTRTAVDETRIHAQIESVFGTLRRLPGFVPATASDVARILESKHAGPGH